MIILDLDALQVLVSIRAHRVNEDMIFLPVAECLIFTTFTAACEGISNSALVLMKDQRLTLQLFFLLQKGKNKTICYLIMMLCDVKDPKTSFTHYIGLNTHSATVVFLLPSKMY